MMLARTNDGDAMGCAASVNRQCYAHNWRLLAGLRGLRRQHPGAVVAYADYYAAHLAVMRSPARYGFAEPFRTCCGSGGGTYDTTSTAALGRRDADPQHRHGADRRLWALRLRLRRRICAAAALCCAYTRLGVLVAWCTSGGSARPVATTAPMSSSGPWPATETHKSRE